MLRTEREIGKLDQSLLAIGGNSTVVVMGDFNGHVGFLGSSGETIMS